MLNEISLVKEIVKASKIVLTPTNELSRRLYCIFLHKVVYFKLMGAVSKLRSNDGGPNTHAYFLGEDYDFQDYNLRSYSRHIIDSLTNIFNRLNSVRCGSSAILKAQVVRVLEDLGARKL